jgi:hypothetical protein
LLYDDNAYVAYQGQIRELMAENDYKLYGNYMNPDKGYVDSDITKNIRQKIKNTRKFKTGGLADFTGPAWLDGTKSRPEYVLNAEQTKHFFTLVDVLDGFKNNESSSEKSGDNYFDIAINVEKLESDYDVEQIANKIRDMIYEDASYRNVNAINLIR